MTSRILLMTVAIALVLPTAADAQLFGIGRKKPAATPPAAAAPAPAKKTIASTVAKTVASNGLFTVYQDTTDGTTHILITEDQLNKAFIYFSYTENGPVPAGQFRGQYRDNVVFQIKKYFDRLEFEVVNTNFYFDPENAVSKAANANISPAVLISEKIVVTEDGKYLIKADGLFMSEAMSRVKPPSFPGQSPFAFNLGQLSRDKNKIVAIRNYPLNTDVIVDYVFENPNPVNGGGNSVTDARSVTIRSQHSFIAVPENDFKPRRADARVGYFTVETDDLTELGPTNFRDFINRWNLVKKDPSAAVSDPVEPITWWIENTTPHHMRDAITEGALAWNIAFEAAGFSNAVAVKVQPDTADWDAGDIRYNVLRWTSSPMPPFGGYGPSFVNPFTGQILGADVMLEYSFMRGTAREDELYDTDGHAHPTNFCSFGLTMQRNHQFAIAHAMAMDRGDEEISRLQNEAIRMLVLHEIGHTLGLNHNMKASQLHDPVSIHDRELTSRVGLTGSVMDYSVVNIARDKSRQGLYYDIVPGPYDVWAIDFGYSPDESRRDAILARSTEKQHAFGNDADDMRAPGKAIDPHVNVNDMSSDAIVYAIERAQIVNEIYGTMLRTIPKDGESYQRLRNTYMRAFGSYAGQMVVVSRYIGGVHVDRAFVAQAGGTQPFTAVPRDRQKQAVSTLETYLFAPDAFKAPGELLAHLQTERRGFNFFSTTEDPKIHDAVLNSQRSVMAHILHPVTTKRMTDSRLYGNQYPVAEFLADLTNAVFRADMGGNVNTFRQNLQLEYITALVGIVTNEGAVKYDRPSQSAALFQLRNIESQLKAKSAGNLETRAHTAHVLQLIDVSLNR